MFRERLHKRLQRLHKQMVSKRTIENSNVYSYSYIIKVKHKNTVEKMKQDIHENASKTVQVTGF